MGKRSTLEQLKEVAVSGCFLEGKEMEEGLLHNSLKKYGYVKLCSYRQAEIRNEMTLSRTCNRVFEGVDLLLFDL